MKDEKRGKREGKERVRREANALVGKGGFSGRPEWCLERCLERWEKGCTEVGEVDEVVEAKMQDDYAGGRSEAARCGGWFGHDASAPT